MLLAPKDSTWTHGIGEFRALVIDDDDLCRDYTATVLTRLGATEVFKAANGADAINRAADYGGELDLVVCDLRMPLIDGVETLKRLGEIAYFPNCIIASAADPRLLRASSALATRFAGRRLLSVSKPVTIEKMQDLLDTINAETPSVDPDNEQAPSPHFQPPDCSTKLMQGTVNQEFIPYFRPILALGTQEVRGVEALLRWRSPRYGILLPENFSTVARSIGLLGDIWYSIILDAVRHWAAWRESGSDLFLKVGLPAQLLAKPDLAHRLDNMIGCHGLPPNRLILTVEEDAWSGNAPVSQEVLTRLCLRGFGLCIDKFGGKHANLQQLLSGPFTEMSIVEDIVQAAPTHPEAAIAFSANLSLARDLGMTVLAPDVTTSSQWEFASTTGCDFATGSFIAEPAPAGAFGDWLEARRSSSTPQAMSAGMQPIQPLNLPSPVHAPS